ncbi:hypothetical protein GCM10009539_71440 [Cryptosporangium japonicum]|uniref:Uncharacterized protein n=1 Tax=Cryptosporangium japonicum TaxID=80872 RepID=A0ABP3EQA9_9ACTN
MKGASEYWCSEYSGSGAEWAPEGDGGAEGAAGRARSDGVVGSPGHGWTGPAYGAPVPGGPLAGTGRPWCGGAGSCVLEGSGLDGSGDDVVGGTSWSASEIADSRSAS